jgi:hypothetical protein
MRSTLPSCFNSQALWSLIDCLHCLRQSTGEPLCGINRINTYLSALQPIPVLNFSSEPHTHFWKIWDSNGIRNSILSHLWKETVYTSVHCTHHTILRLFHSREPTRQEVNLFWFHQSFMAGDQACNNILLGQILLTHELKRGEDKHCWNYFNNNAVPTMYAMLQNVKVC